MSHYFTKSDSTLKSNPKRIAFRAHNEDITCITDHGVFAKDGLDRGTNVLLQYLTIESSAKTALDLGCGYGPIGITLAKAYDLAVDMTDVNQRALDLATQNLALNNVKATVLESDGFTALTKVYDLIVTNPPIRVGKETLYSLLSSTKDHLQPNGSMWFVINKKHGAESALRFIQTVFETVTVVGKHKGFYVIQCRK
jgi:16S rRNA (guanine1207-N2)-methyltransferase